jgi:hypothetical protein
MMKTFRLLGTFLINTARVIGQGFVAFFMFTEEDVKILLSAYGYHTPEVDRFHDGRSHENEKSAATPRRMKHDSALGPGDEQILLGVHPELTSMTVSNAPREQVRRHDKFE